MNIDRLLVAHCAPTLAGLKMAALICVEDTSHYDAMVVQYNAKYNTRGLFFRTLGQCKQRQLLYVYRKADVLRNLRMPSVQTFLEGYGYTSSWTVEESLHWLSNRIREAQDFPHELGVFLGYPLEDVKAFIACKGEHAICTGEWKVYTDTDYAQRQFSQYAFCRQCYVTLFERGYSMNYLIIA